jgi:hypothetical protein
MRGGETISMRSLTEHHQRSSSTFQEFDSPLQTVLVVLIHLLLIRQTLRFLKDGGKSGRLFVKLLVRPRQLFDFLLQLLGFCLLLRQLGSICRDLFSEL